MSKLKVRTTQNVELEFEVASTGQRILSAIIDLLVIGVYWFAMSNVINVLFGSGDMIEGLDEGTISTPKLVFTTLFIAIPTFIYYPVLEYFWQGQTIGKYLLKCKVVQIDGSRLTLGSIVLRWLLRQIDANSILLVSILYYMGLIDGWLLIILALYSPFPIIGLISMARSKIGQRLGDRAANTTVVLMKRQISLKDTILRMQKPDYQPKYSNVLLFSDRDIRIIKNTLQEYKHTNDATKIRILAKKSKEMLGVTEKVKVVPFLERIIRDYNALANHEEAA